MTSELVSNAVRHAQLDRDDTISLNVEIDSRVVRVSIVDGGAGFDATRLVRDAGADEGGWGLFLVKEMSSRWGIEKDPHSVWFEIDRDP